MSPHLKYRLSLWLLSALSLSPGLLAAQEIVEFTTPGPSSFTVPANVSRISVQIWGAGAGGRAETGQSAGGGGGGFAGLTSLAVSPNEEYRVFVGAGGAAGAVGEPSAFGGVAPVVPAGCIGTDADACAAGGRVTEPPGSYGGCSTDLGAVPPDVCVGDEVFAGGNGAAPGSNIGGGGGGSAFVDGAGGAGASGTDGGAGGIGTGNGGDGGDSASGSPGTFPGGGGGGRGAGATGLTSGAGAGGRIIVTYDSPTSATAIPTASTWGLLLLSGLLGALGARKLRRLG